MKYRKKNWTVSKKWTNKRKTHSTENSMIGTWAKGVGGSKG